jgi:hypothetical protein
MSKGKLARTSVFVGQDQLERLRQISNESGVPLAFMVRRGISLYLDSVSRGPAPRSGSSIAGSQSNFADASAIPASVEPGNL